jgi:hypothetical protein
MPAPAKFLWPWIDCVNDSFAGSACQELQKRVPGGYVPNLPIRSDPTDVGPFGHYDLFGSQWELTTTTFYNDQEPLYQEALDCAQSGMAPPDSTSGWSHALYSPALGFRAFTPDVYDGATVEIADEETVQNQAMWGVRCAYSTVGNGDQ